MHNKHVYPLHTLPPICIVAKYYFAILVWKVFNLQIVHSFRKIFAHILFVEAHRWGD